MEFTQIGNYQIYILNDNEIAVTGNTYTIKDTLIKMGGRFQRNIQINGVPTIGWTFPSIKNNEIKEFLKTLIPKTLFPKQIEIIPYDVADLVAIQLEKIYKVANKDILKDVIIEEKDNQIIIKGIYYKVEEILKDYMKDYKIISQAKVLENSYITLKKNN